MLHGYFICSLKPDDMIHSTTDQLAREISEIISDYRNDDGIVLSDVDVLEWVDQFEEQDRLFLLSETKRILESRYFSKADTFDYLASLLDRLPTMVNVQNKEDFWRNALFLDLQKQGKSQGVMLAMLWEVAEEKFGLMKNMSGADSHRYIIYLDDVLCTGNTLFYNMKDWLEEDINGNPRRLILNSNTLFIAAYMVVHTLNLRKVSGRFYHLDQKNPFWFDHIDKLVTVDNNYESPRAALDFVFPKQEGLSEFSVEYSSRISGAGKHVIFRAAGRPYREEFYSSPENRDRYEQVFLEKGIELLAGVKEPKVNMRPLGFSLPSYRDLGFGALAFTWRNVPNNTPLAFWYSSPGWKPLFPKRDSR